MFKKSLRLITLLALVAFGGVSQNILLSNTNVHAITVTDKLERVLSKLSISQSQKQFVREVYPEAMKSYREKGILPSITIAQAILESSWGNSELAKSPNYNLFGIKASSD